MSMEGLLGLEAPAEEIEVIEERTLSVAERQELEMCEAAIGAGIESEVAASLALGLISKKRLYRGTHRRFEDYVEERWKISRSRAYQRIEAARVMENVQNSGHSRLPSVGQATALAAVKDPEEQQAVWKQTVEEPGPVTAKKVEAIIERRRAPEREDERARAYALCSQLAAERDTARLLVQMPGLPIDRCVAILERLISLSSEESAELLIRWRSEDEREQKTAFALMQGKHPPADPRRLILESFLPEMVHCKEMFPADPLSGEIGLVIVRLERVIESIKEQEGVRTNGSVHD